MIYIEPALAFPVHATEVSHTHCGEIWPRGRLRRPCGRPAPPERMKGNKYEYGSSFRTHTSKWYDTSRTATGTKNNMYGA
eukprot:scaffold677782_cov62-Prasinocladus_malaysianus.AAC.1